MDAQYFLKSGTLLKEQYRIQALLGEGGMGAVYQAQDEKLDYPCAVKEVRLTHLPTQADIDAISPANDTGVRIPGKPRVTREKMIDQFGQEAKLLNKLEHPNLPRVRHFFDDDDRLYLVMTLVEGEDLEIKLEHQKGPFPAKQVVDWIDQVLDALIYCHKNGVIHRDIKPANIIVRADEKAYLVDFGIARYVDATHTTVSAQAHTPGFSPPEQYTARTDARSDIYSLGATMYILLSCEPPQDAFDRAENDLLKPLASLVPSISPALNAAVMKAMAIRRSDRFQTVEEMRSAIQAAMETKAVDRGPVPPERVKGNESFGPALFGVLLLTTVLVLAIAVGRNTTPQQPTGTPVPTGAPVDTPWKPGPTSDPTYTVEVPTIVPAGSFAVTLPSPLDPDDKLGLPVKVSVTVQIDQLAIKSGLDSTVDALVSDTLQNVRLLLIPQPGLSTTELEAGVDLTCEFYYEGDDVRLAGVAPVRMTIDPASPFEILLSWQQPRRTPRAMPSAMPVMVTWKGNDQATITYTGEIELAP